MELVVNGAPGASIRLPPRLLTSCARLSLEGKRIAVERNGEIVPKSRYGDTLVASGDRLEVVSAVGGG